MKIKFGKSFVALAVLCGSGPVWAQPATNNYYTRERDQVQSNAERLGNLQRANNLLGDDIKDAQGNNVGSLKDFAVDLQNGRILEVIVGTGGVLGMDEKLHAVPPAEFTYDAANKTLRLNADKSQVTSSPAFKMSQWQQNVTTTSVGEVYEYYKARPYFSTESQSTADRTRNTSQLGQVERASKVIGTSVRNLQDERLGNVEDMMVNLPAGRVVEVILGSGGFLGMGGELSAVPPQSFRYGIHPDLLTLDTTKEALTSAPHFKSADWETSTHPDQVWTVYHSYNVPPYFSTNYNADNTAQNVRERDTNSVTPMDQGNSQADLDTTSEIRRQIMAASGLSVDAQNAKVITLNGHVTLRGPVESERERQTIADIAAKVASAANVDNELQIISNTDTNSVK